MDGKLKRLLIFYGLSAFIATSLISGAILTNKYITSLSNTLNQFQTLKINYYKMRGAVREMEETSSRVQSIIPSDYKPEEMEGAVLAIVDSIKTRMKGVSIETGNFERKENEIILPITITGTVHEYAIFLQELRYLQSLISPFMFIETVSITKSLFETKEVVVYNIKGILKIQSRTTGGKT